MDPSLYKDFTTSRGVKYRYFFSPSRDAKPTLLFVHGFPSTSYDWRHQVVFFQSEGYGLLVPDTLGYGGTDKPEDLEMYKFNDMSIDINDILYAEKVNNVFAIGHDWGSALVSRLAVSYPNRFLGFGFLAVGYVPPAPDFDVDKILAITKQTIGYETLGYWKFFAADRAATIIEEHFDSFFSLLFPQDPKIWATNFCPIGEAEAWLLADKKTLLPPYISEAEKQKVQEKLLAGGFKAPLNYYKAMVDGLRAEEDQEILEENYTIDRPVFFGGAKHDYICLTEGAQVALKQYCKNTTIKVFDTDHWIQLAAPDEVNQELLAWIEGIKGIKV